MSKLSNTDTMILLGIIGIVVYALMTYSLDISNNDTIWIAWIIISIILLVVGITIKVYTKNSSSEI